MDILELKELPLTKEQIYEYIDGISSKMVKISLKDCKFESYDKMLTYMANCDIRHCVLDVDYDDESTDEFIKSYVRFERRVDMPNINEAILSVIYENEKPIYINESLERFIIRFRKNNADLIDKIHDFFYNLNLAVSSTIVLEDKDLDNSIKNAPVIDKLDGIGLSLLSIYSTMKFGEYLYNLKRDIKHYNAFYVPNIEGRTMITYIIDTFIPYKAMFLYNDMVRHPENKEQLQIQLNETIDLLRKEAKDNDSSDKG